MSAPAEFGDEEGPEEQQSYSATRKQLIILGFFPLSEAIAWTAIFPYIYAMIQSFSPSPEADDQNTAVYAGIMVSVFTFGEFVMAPQWARVSDRIGRKPALLIGSAGAIFSAMLLGFSSSLPMAIAARTCAGLLNPNLGVVQTIVGELVRKDQQAKGFSVVPSLRGFGTIIGPVIGGHLAEPVKKYPSIFLPGSIWDRYPYLLPNVAVSILLLASCILGFFALKESNPRFRGRSDIGRGLPSGIINLINGRRWHDKGGGYVSVSTGEDTIELTHADGSPNGNPESQPPEPRSPFTKRVWLQIAQNATQGFIKIATLATIPIFLATPPQPSKAVSTENKTPRSIFAINGGFGLSIQGISNALLSQAIASIAAQTFVVPRVIAKQGPLRSLRLVLVVLMCLFCTIPFTAGLPGQLGIPAILVMLWVYALVNGLVTTCLVILITNSSPSPLYLATINGRAASLGCLARTLGPIVSGPLFRLGLRVGYIGLPFWALGGIAGVGLVVSYFSDDDT
ncbi:MAG: hypothetical protein M1839_002553 [Geoglossum umbratile]|nr:MAG: hypothetical protein M1839_002553 [Geoglossum umbratile]